MTTTGAVISVLLTVETFGVLWLWLQRAVPSLYLRWGRNDPTRTVLLVLGSHLAWLSIAASIAFAFAQTEPVGEERATWGLAITPLLAILGPFSQVWFARWPGDFLTDRAELVAQGASPETAKAFFWTGAVFAHIAIVVAVFALVACFAPTPTRVEPDPGFASCGQTGKVMVTGTNPPPCELVMSIVAEIAGDPEASTGGYLNRNVRGFDCNANNGVAVCFNERATIAFNVPSSKLSN